MHRLDKVLSHALNISRSDVKKALKDGVVSINNHIIKDAGIKVNEKDIVQFNNEVIECFPHELIMIHKPMGVVCSKSDSHYPSVFEVFNLSSKQYHMIGRLDQDTTGLLLLTTNGQLTHQLMSPQKKVSKHYQVTLDHPISEEAIKQLESGVDIQDETLCAGAKVIVHEDNLIELIIHEGRYHQVKRMMHALGYEVLKLHRSQVSFLKLEDLKIGEWRACTEAEIQQLKHGEINKYSL
jgi:16S rRNA pseudouridine516 synthase